MGLQWGEIEGGQIEAAAIVSIIIMGLTLGLALIARSFGLRIGIRQDVRAREDARKTQDGGVRADAPSVR